MDSQFNLELAQVYYGSSDQFPIDFDDAWQWLGYSNKANAKRQLVRFKEGLDFSSQLMKTPQGGRPNEIIKISCDCFKMLAMLAETEFGDTARKYFLECERIAKVKYQEQQQPKQLTSIERADKVNYLAASLQFFGVEIQNPRFKQEVQDLVCDMLGLKLKENFLSPLVISSGMSIE